MSESNPVTIEGDFSKAKEHCESVENIKNPEMRSGLLTGQFILMTTEYEDSDSKVIDTNVNFGRMDIAPAVEDTIIIDNIDFTEPSNNMVKSQNNILINFTLTQKMFPYDILVFHFPEALDAKKLTSCGGEYYLENSNETAFFSTDGVSDVPCLPGD